VSDRKRGERQRVVSKTEAVANQVFLVIGDYGVPDCGNGYKDEV